MLMQQLKTKYYAHNQSELQTRNIKEIKSQMRRREEQLRTKHTHPQYLPQSITRELFQ
jgi:hypothetical protein